MINGNLKIKSKPLIFISIYCIYCLSIIFLYSNFDKGLADALLYIDRDRYPLELVILNYSSPATIFTILLLSNLPNNRFVASFVIRIITSLFFYLKLNRFLFLKNSQLLWITIFAPGFALWSSIPSKEAVFIFFSFFYICFEAHNIVEKSFKEINQINLIFIRLLFVSFTIFLRGFLGIPYIFLALSLSSYPLYSYFLKKIQRIKNITFYFLLFSSLIAIVIVFLLNEMDIDFFSNITLVLNSSFLWEYANFSREFLSDRNPLEIKNFIIMPFLSFFPTIEELLSNKLLFFVVIDSILFISVYFLIWNKLLNIKNISYSKIKFFQFIFISISILYIIIYPIVGAFNLGSSLRLRQNFVNLGHVFPIIVFYSYRAKTRKLKYLNNSDYSKLSTIR